jgi:hypothetical protein
MNLGLNTIDISGFLVDEHSFLGQTIKLGIDYNQLPPDADDSLRMYLQSYTMMFGQRNRTGIAIGREELEQGVFQATVCLEIGLIDQSGGDANKALEIVATGDFESLRKLGWELAFFRLKEMQDEAQLFPKRREAAFLQDYADPVRRWAYTAPQTWLCTDPDEEDGPTIADPAKAYETFQDLALRVALLKSLPPDALKRFGSAAGSRGPFSEILKNLILSLVLGKESLVATVEDVALFENMISSKASSPDGLNTLADRFRQQVGEGVDPSVADRFIRSVRAEVRELVAFGSDLRGQFIVQNV